MNYKNFILILESSNENDLDKATIKRIVSELKGIVPSVKAFINKDKEFLYKWNMEVSFYPTPNFDTIDEWFIVDYTWNSRWVRIDNTGDEQKDYRRAENGDYRELDKWINSLENLIVNKAKAKGWKYRKGTRGDSNSLVKTFNDIEIVIDLYVGDNDGNIIRPSFYL